MKNQMLMIMFLVLFTCLQAIDQESYVPIGHPAYPNFISSEVDHIHKSAPNWTFATPPTNILASYYDYMIGSYNNLPMRLVPDAQGGGYFITYHGQRSMNGLRRVFINFITSNGTITVNNELTSNQIREGYPALDVDPVSGKPLFAWHSDVEPTDAEMEVSTCWDAFLQGIPGLFSEPTITIDNPMPISLTNGSIVPDNEFIWPTVEIGPSPTVGMRRVYVMGRNSISHTSNPSENLLIAWADFNAQMLESGSSLSWSYTHIPELDNWNNDTIYWRRGYYSLVAGNDDRIYCAGYHSGVLYADNSNLNEPDMDVFVCDNYGQGNWQHYSASSKLPSWNPRNLNGTGQGFFLDNDNVPYHDSDLYWQIESSGHHNAVIDANGLIHLHAMWTLTTDIDVYFPELNTIKEMTYDTNSHQFAIREVYPIAGSSSDTLAWQPWDTDGNGEVDQYAPETGDPIIQGDWNLCYWDDTAGDGMIRFNYNNFKVTQPNSSGWMASVWQNSWKARMYNTNPVSYPELASYQLVPEIYISISSDNGINWSEPIIINSIETPGFADNRPMWVYPSDQIKDMGIMNGHLIGKLGILYFDDNSWGAGCISNPVGQADGGIVKYMILNIEFQIPEPSGITGTVKRIDNQLPIPNAIITSGQYSTTTNEQGNYSLELHAGTYDLHVSAEGFITQTVPEVTVQNELFTTLDVSLAAIPHIAVSGFVQAENPPIALDGASITLTGSHNYAGTSDTNGDFIFTDVLTNQIYHYTVTKNGYSTATGSINIQDSNYEMGTIILSENTSAPTEVVATVQQGNHTVYIQWLRPSTMIRSSNTQENNWKQNDRSLTGFKVWRFHQGQESNENAWILIDELSATDYYVSDTNWQTLYPGLYCYAVKSQFSEVLLSAPAFSNAVERVSDPPIVYVTRIISASPNPFFSSINIDYELKTSNPARFEIYNVNGQHVKSLACTSHSGINHVSWDGSNDAGEKVTSGLYLFRLMTDSKVITKKMMRIK
jgi:hypothetical protein